MISRSDAQAAQSFGLTNADLPAMADTPEATRFDLRTWWPADRRELPFELEIGSGKGTFMVQQATQTPGINYLGIEWAREFWAYAADRVRRHNLPGVRMLHTDATVFVRWYVPDAFFRQVHIYFPDPWPKKRHHKRRSITADFLRELHRVLTPSGGSGGGGMVRIVTDHEEYWQWITEHAARVTDIYEEVPFERPIGAGEGEVVGTNFERKYRREGRPFHAMTLRKKD